MVSVCLACMKSLVLSPVFHTSGIVVHADNLSTWEVEPEGSEVQDHPQIRIESDTNLDYMRPCLTKTKTRREASTGAAGRGSHKAGA